MEESSSSNAVVQEHSHTLTVQGSVSESPATAAVRVGSYGLQYGLKEKNKSTISKLLQYFELTPDRQAAYADTFSAIVKKGIQNGDELLYLLIHPSLTSEQRQQIWTIILPGLSTLIKNGYILNELLRCANVTYEQRDQIWAAVSKRLPEIIQDAEQLRFLLLNDNLSSDQRDQIWAAVSGRLSILIRNFTQLCFLLQNPHLNNEHHTHIINAVSEQLPTLYKNLGDIHLLLSIENLNPDRYTQIFTAIGLSKLCKNFRDLNAVLVTKKLNPELRMQILEAAAEYMVNRSANELFYWLFLNPCLNATLRAKILEFAIASEEPSIKSLFEKPLVLASILLNDNLPDDERGEFATKFFTAPCIKTLKENVAGLNLDNSDLIIRQFELVHFTSSEVRELQKLIYTEQIDSTEGLSKLFYKIQSISEWNNNFKYSIFTPQEELLLKNFLDKINRNDLSEKLLTSHLRKTIANLKEVIPNFKEALEALKIYYMVQSKGNVDSVKIELETIRAMLVSLEREEGVADTFERIHLTGNGLYRFVATQLAPLCILLKEVKTFIANRAEIALPLSAAACTTVTLFGVSHTTRPSIYLDAASSECGKNMNGWRSAIPAL